MLCKWNKNNRVRKTIVLTTIIACVAHAEPPQKKKDFTHDFIVGLESFKYHYGEATPNMPNFMQLNGMMYGMNGAYQLTYKDTVFIRPEVRWAYGHTDYTNGKKGTDYELDQIPSMIFEPRLIMGSLLKATEQLTIAPYSGVGWRYKRDDSVDIITKNNFPGVNRINKSWYIPLGARFQYDVNDRWNLHGFLEYDWFVSGRQSTYRKDHIRLARVHGGGHVPYRTTYIPSTPVYKQNNGWGAKAEVLIGYRFDKVGIAFGPYIHYWHIQKSSVMPVATRIELLDNGNVFNNPPSDSNEPNNVTKEIGLKVNFYF